MERCWETYKQSTPPLVSSRSNRLIVHHEQRLVHGISSRRLSCTRLLIVCPTTSCPISHVCSDSTWTRPSVIFRRPAPCTIPPSCHLHHQPGRITSSCPELLIGTLEPQSTKSHDSCTSSRPQIGEPEKSEECSLLNNPTNKPSDRAEIVANVRNRIRPAVRANG